jgi:hypothetical protein
LGHDSRLSAVIPAKARPAFAGMTEKLHLALLENLPTVVNCPIISFESRKNKKEEILLSRRLYYSSSLFFAEIRTASETRRAQKQRCQQASFVRLLWATHTD